MDNERVVSVSETDISTTSPQEARIPPIDRQLETKLLRKLDLHIIPALFLIYFLCFLDRSNIGNAKIQGMTEDLGLDVGDRYNIALFIFFVPYILFELPSNIILKYVRPSYYLGGLVFCWGIVNMCMGFAQSFQTLAILRFLMGLSEAGLYPGMMYLTSMYYKRHEFSKRVTALWSASLLSGAFSGLLAYGISYLGGRRGYKAWRWIFIVEGGATAAASILTVFFIADWPEKARFLTDKERELVRRRLSEDNMQEMNVLDRHSVKLIVTDWKIWINGIMSMGSIVTGYSMSYFLPTILNEMGWEAADAQIHTVPVYLAAWVVSLALSWASDRTRHRYAFIAGPALVSTVGYVMLLCQYQLDNKAKYAAVFIVEIGGIVPPLCITWLMNNVSGHWKRAAASAMANTVGNLGGFVASNIFLAREQPYYPTGYGVALASIWITILCATATVIGMHRENRTRERGGRDGRRSLPPDRLRNMGDAHPEFRFTL